MLSTSRFVTSDDEMLRELMIGTSVPRELSECHEDRFRLLCETAFDGVLTVQDGIIRETNQAFARMVGHAGEDLSGQALTRFIAAAARGTQVYDSPCQRKDGSTLFVEITTTDLGSGRQILALRNITHRRDTEERLVESESRYRYLVEHTHDLICVHDLEGRILSVNSSAARMLGISADELQTLNVRDILAPGDEARFDRYLEVLRWQGTAEGKMRVMTRDGRIRVWEYRNTVRTSGVAVPVVRGLARDITEREQALEAVQKNEEYFRSIIENASDVIGILDPTGVIRYHSPSLERSLGLAQDELTGSPLIDHVHPDDLNRIGEFILRQASGLADGSTIRIRLKQRSGSYRFFEMIAKNLMRGGQVQSIIINARDVTDRELLERQLEQANRVAGLGRLAATVAHEFNNVLMGIQPFADLLQRPNAPRPLLEKCGGHIANSIKRGKRVAMDILRFTQPAAAVLKPLNLERWWQQLEPELKAQIGNHIAFTAEFPDVEVRADATQLAQVFANFVSNARDAMPHAGQLTISVRQPAANESFAFGTVPDPSSLVQISVADTGTGIAPDVIGHVFDPLFTTKESGGTGLGLAVAHQVITRHGGYVFVESAIGAGTTFHVFLPRVASTEPQEQVEHVAPRAVRTRQVLVVDDDATIVDGMVELLASEGITASAVSTGLAAAAAVERLRPELVVLDVGLPDISGYDVAKQLRALHPTLPIIFATGHGDREQVGLDRYSCFLQKPFDFDALLGTISTLENVDTDPGGA